MSIFADYLATRSETSDSVETDSEEDKVSEAASATEAEKSESSSEPPVLPLNKISMLECALMCLVFFDLPSLQQLCPVPVVAAVAVAAVVFVLGLR
jgi:hypothetical protein